jgi:hypothetical protein
MPGEEGKYPGSVGLQVADDISICERTGSAVADVAGLAALS